MLQKSDKIRWSKGNHHDADADISSEEDDPDSNESDNDRRPKKKAKKMVSTLHSHTSILIQCCTTVWKR